MVINYKRKERSTLDARTAVSSSQSDWDIKKKEMSVLRGPPTRRRFRRNKMTGENKYRNKKTINIGVDGLAINYGSTEPIDLIWHLHHCRRKYALRHIFIATNRRTNDILCSWPRFVRNWTGWAARCMPLLMGTVMGAQINSGLPNARWQ